MSKYILNSELMCVLHVCGELLECVLIFICTAEKVLNISCYSLSIEESTAHFFDQVETNLESKLNPLLHLAWSLRTKSVDQFINSEDDSKQLDMDSLELISHCSKKNMTLQECK